MTPTKVFLVAMALAVPALSFSSTTAEAKRIEQACMRSDRNRASAPLCGCIQRVADQVLTRSDQRLAAKFFSDPQLAQDIRQSDRRKHEEFWLRYRNFGSTAQRVCR